jgi:hypothetical protein
LNILNIDFDPQLSFEKPNITSSVNTQNSNPRPMNNSFKNTSLLVIMFILSFNLLNAQSKQFDTRKMCFDFHSYYCKFEEKLINFDYNAQSRSTLFRRGETSEMYFIAYKGYDYRLSFCAQEDLLEGQKIAFFIRNGKTKELIYENSSENFPQEFEFSCTSSTRILVEVSLPPETGNKLKAGNKFEYKGCLGVLIESRRSPSTGFSRK